MAASQTTQTRVDQNDGILIKVTSEAADAQSDGLFHISQEVFLVGDQFIDELSGTVKRVSINRNNRRKGGVILHRQFPERHSKFASLEAGQSQAADRLAIIPESVIAYLTKTSGFLDIDSIETTRYQDFNSTQVVRPDADWIPPYPYCVESVRFFNEQ